LKRPWALPFVPLYVAGVVLRSASLRFGFERIQHLSWPVISMGSVSAGGAGKTPFVIALARLLKSQDLNLDVLSRGYGRSTSAPTAVNPNGTAKSYGDEPLLIAREADVPVYVAARRFDAGILAETVAAQSGITKGIHLLDDGFQHRQLARDIDIVLVSSEDIEDSLLPAGNRRESLSALKRAHVLAVSAGNHAAIEQLRGMDLQQPIWLYRREMIVPSKALETPAIAFCGIARPSQFFSGLERAGVALTATHVFPDHHPFAPRDLKMLQRLATKSGAKSLITTPKDHVRLAALANELTREIPLYTADLRVVLEDEPDIVAWLQTVLPPASSL